MFNLISIGEKIRRARTAGGITQAELAERANVSRATISAIESGTIKEIGINRLMEIVRTADNIQPSTSTSPTQAQAVSRKSQTLDLSFPYDWSNSAISDEVLIDRVIERGIFEDIVRIYAAYGEQMLGKRLAVFLSKNPASSKSLTRMFDSIISAAQKVA